MSKIEKLSTHRFRKTHPRSEVTGPNLTTLKGLIDTVKQLGFNIIVGTQDQINAGEATHTVANFIAAIQNNFRVLILAGTHVLTQSETITESGVVIQFEDRSAIIAFSTFILTISGAENRFEFKADNIGDNDLVVSGNFNHVTVWITNAGTTPINNTGTDNVITSHKVS